MKMRPILSPVQKPWPTCLNTPPKVGAVCSSTSRPKQVPHVPPPPSSPNAPIPSPNPSTAPKVLLVPLGCTVSLDTSDVPSMSGPQPPDLKGLGLGLGNPPIPPHLLRQGITSESAAPVPRGHPRTPWRLKATAKQAWPTLCHDRQTVYLVI
mmetsp:Transcript_11085/g.19859  ORF Transcript_11085/g.19859 Transcript_11085/m.19859 type:complete len:152 (+) Transcript_11085:3207-3662(+)